MFAHPLQIAPSVKLRNVKRKIWLEKTPNNAAKHLKHTIIGDIRTKFDTTVATSTNFDYSMEEEDIYKYYSDTEGTEEETVVEQEMTEEEMLLKFFDVDPNKL